jgi:glycosyltransferase involved in cell wall biosynthesis
VITAGIRAELIVVDDGSTDDTPRLLQELSEKHTWIRPIRHADRMGQSAAMLTGFAAARGRWAATLDADLQNDPADLPAMLEKVRNGDADMVQGARMKRQDSAWRKFGSWVGRSTRRLLLGDPIRDTGCSTRVIATDIAKQLPLQFRGMHRFLPVYARMLGATIIEMPVNHRPRNAGQTKYGNFSRAVAGLIDCFAVRWMRKRLCAPPREGTEA